MEIIGTVQGPDGSQERVTVYGAGYDAAYATLREQIPEGHKLIVIRTA